MTPTTRIPEGPTLDEAWAEAEQAFIAAQGDDDGFGVEIGYWDEFPDAPWTVSAFDTAANGRTLSQALGALASNLRDQHARAARPHEEPV